MMISFQPVILPEKVSLVFAFKAKESINSYSFIYECRIALVINL